MLGPRGCGANADDDLPGGEVSGEDIRKARRVLERDDWAQGASLADAAASLELNTVKHPTGVYRILGKHVMERCGNKPVES